eukprot:COSAG06_NODE_1228_length_10179_cov_3.735119_4_plen_86_part_00
MVLEYVVLATGTYPELIYGTRCAGSNKANESRKKKTKKTGAGANEKGASRSRFAEALHVDSAPSRDFGPDARARCRRRQVQFMAA